MRITRLIILLTAAFTLIPQCLHADKRGRSTQAERDRYNALVRRLVDAPLDPPGEKEVAWAFTLAVEIPDFTVKMCGNDGVKVLSGYKRHPELHTLYLLAPLAVQFQHADNIMNQPAIDTLTWNWILDAYEKIAAARPDDRLQFLDDALALRKAGKLSGFVEKVSCAKGRDWHEPPAWALHPPASALPATPPASPR